jgi:hypothetical protein
MGAETKIDVGNFKWEYEAESRATLTGDRNSRKREVIGIRGMDAHCTCGAKWHAPRSSSPAPGSFTHLVGGFTIICPHCGHEEGFPDPAMPE